MKTLNWVKITLLAIIFLTSHSFANPGLAQSEEEGAAPIGALDAARNKLVSKDDLELFLLPLTASDLSSVAQSWQSHLRTELNGLANTNLALRQAADATEDVLRERFAAQRNEISEIISKYQSVLVAWAAKGGAEADIALHHRYISAVATGTLATTDVRTLIDSALEWLTAKNGGLRILFGVAGMLVTMWVMMLLARIIRNMARRGLEKVPTMSQLLKSFVVGTVYWATLVLGVLVALGLFGINVTPLFAVFGGLSFILGFALQETLGNLASGLMIMILKPFDTGDYIEVGGASGTVDEMSVVSTQIRTFDNQIIVVPNRKIWGDVITNVSASDTRRVDLVFGIAYSDSAAHAITVLKSLVAEHDLCLDEPLPEIFVGELGDNSVNVFCRPWVKTEDYWTVYWDLTGAAKERFDDEGISIPFPQRDVHLIPVEAQS